jgi:anthranilate phosphoribosyltransferase
MNISASLANPALPRFGVRGVYARDMVEPVARVMREIGYKRALVFHGSNGYGRGMDEVSIFGETFCAEIFDTSEIRTYTMKPEAFPIKNADESEVYPNGNRVAEAKRLIQILSGAKSGADYQLVCANAAPILYIAGKAKDLKHGYEMAESIIKSGKALTKLRQWVATQNTDPKTGLNKFDCLLANIEMTLK